MGKIVRVRTKAHLELMRTVDAETCCREHGNALFIDNDIPIGEVLSCLDEQLTFDPDKLNVYRDVWEKAPPCNALKNCYCFAKNRSLAEIVDHGISNDRWRIGPIDARKPGKLGVAGRASAVRQ